MLRKLTLVLIVVSLCLINIRASFIAVGLSNSSIAVWDDERSQLETILPAHQSPIVYLKTINDQHLISVALNEPIKIWSMHTFNLIKTIDIDAELVELLSTGYLVAIKSNLMHIVDLTNGALVESINVTSPVACIRRLNWGDLFATGDTVGKIYLWNSANLSLYRMIGAHAYTFGVESMSDDHIITGGYALFRIWQISTPSPLLKCNIDPGVRNIRYILLTNDEKNVVIAGDSTFIQIISISSTYDCVLYKTIEFSASWVNGLILNNRNQIFVSVGISQMMIVNELNFDDERSNVTVAYPLTTKKLAYTSVSIDPPKAASFVMFLDQTLADGQNFTMSEFNNVENKVLCLNKCRSVNGCQAVMYQGTTCILYNVTSQFTSIVYAEGSVLIQKIIP